MQISDNLNNSFNFQEALEEEIKGFDPKNKLKYVMFVDDTNLFCSGGNIKDLLINVEIELMKYHQSYLNCCYDVTICSKSSVYASIVAFLIVTQS